MLQLQRQQVLTGYSVSGVFNSGLDVKRGSYRRRRSNGRRRSYVSLIGSYTLYTARWVATNCRRERWRGVEAAFHYTRRVARPLGGCLYGVAITVHARMIPGQGCLCDTGSLVQLHHHHLVELPTALAAPGSYTTTGSALPSVCLSVCPHDCWRYVAL